MTHSREVAATNAIRTSKASPVLRLVEYFPSVAGTHASQHDDIE